MNGKFALIIGNTEYIDPGLAQLSAPGKDAEDFARVLKDRESCAFDDVKVILNQPEHIVRKTIDDFLNQKKSDDLLVLYFSGHGVRDELGALYLAVKNTMRNRLRSTAIKSDYIREAMDQSRSRRQVLILDCCNSGAFAQGTKSAIGMSVGTATAFESGYGRITLTASDATQFAWEGDKVIGETDNSLFTHFLVEGLEGGADADGDGRITVDELYDYAYDKVVAATPKQTPSKFSSKQQGEIVLRENISIEHTKPMPLPDDLIKAIHNSLTLVREGAVKQLDELQKSANRGLAQSARAKLEQIASEDDSLHIREIAKQAVIDVPFQGQKVMIKPARSASKTDKSTPPSKPPVTKTAFQSSQHQPLPRVLIIAIGIIAVVVLSVKVIQINWPSFPSGQPVEVSVAARHALPISGDTTTPVSSAAPKISPSETNIPFTPTVFPVVAVDQSAAIPSDPAMFIYYYFDNINKRNYDLTWSLLSDKYKDKTNPIGQGKYIDFWNGYEKVVITSVSPVYLTDTSAKISLKAVFYKNGSTSNHDITYYLTSDNPQRHWLFDVAPAALGSASDITCSIAPKRLEVGIRAEVVTATDPLLLRNTPSENTTVLERMAPGTVVTVIDGPLCGPYRSVYFWWWKVLAPSGKTGWVVEGSDVTDLIFIQPAE